MDTESKTTPEPEFEETADGGVIVHGLDDESADTGAQTGADTSTESGDATTRTATGEDHEDDARGDDAAAAAGRTEAEREAIRARRREERAQRKQAQREREDNLRAELRAANSQIQTLQEGMAQIQRRMNGTDLAQLDAAIKRAGDTADYYKSIIADATKKQDGEAVAAATEAMIQARTEADRLSGVRKQFSTQAARPNPGAVDPRLKSQAENWMQRNAWYNPQSNDADAQVLRALDNAVMQEGFDPRTASYWEELDSRVQKYLPHRAAKGDRTTRQDQDYTSDTTAQGRQRTPVSGSGRDGQSAGGAGARQGGQGYQLSAERVQALKEAGMWDDPKTRADMIRRYRDMDRAAQSQR